MNGATLARADIPLPGGDEAVFNASGLAYFRRGDWLGSARLSSTPAGTVYAARAFTPCGAPYDESGGSGDRDFTGAEQDIAPNKYDFLQREYEPLSGRWFTPDPAGLAAVDPNNPQTWNRYAYVGGNPLSAVDPLGLREERCFDCVVDSGCGSCGMGGGGGGCVFFTTNGPGDACFGNDIFDAIDGEPGTEVADQQGTLVWGFSVDKWFSDQADGEDKWEAAHAPATKENGQCVAKGLGKTFDAQVAVTGWAGDIGGHENYNVTLTFASQAAAGAFGASYNAAMNGWAPPARFGPGPALHLENLSSSWTVSGSTYSISGTAHIDLYNPDTGLGGEVGHALIDGVLGHLGNGSLDPQSCPY